MQREGELFEGRYRIGALLGEGGMGVVHAAINVYSGADVAIKRISKEVAERNALGGRLLAESRVLALLDHPNIVRLLDCGPISGGGLYIAMERVDGDSLRALIRSASKRGKVLDLDLVVPVIAQVAEAMELAHRKKIYHRDLKPENIMVCKGGTAKVLDFGLAKMPSVGRLPGVSPTNPENVVGTPRYMAPEQVRGKEIDARTDVYALGVVLYEAVSGRTPYDANEDAGTTVTEIMGHHVFADPTPVRDHVPTCPDRLWRIIQRCLAKSPKDRHPDMASLARDLRAALEEMVAPPVVRRPLEVPKPSIQPVDEQPNDTLPDAAPPEARVTEPMPATFDPRDPLPFSSRPPPPEPAPTPLRAHDVQTTAELLPSFQPASPLRFVPPPASPQLGVGHTQRMPSASTLLAAQQPAAPARDSGDGAAMRSGPGFAFEPTTPDGLRIAGRSPRMRISPYLVPPFGLALAVLGMLFVMKLRDTTGATGARPQASAIAPASSTAPPPLPEASASPPAASEAPALPSSTSAPAAPPDPPTAPASSAARQAPPVVAPARRPPRPIASAPPRPAPVPWIAPAAPTAKAKNRMFGAEP